LEESALADRSRQLWRAEACRMEGRESVVDVAGKRVLVAEDNRVMSDVIRFNLQRTGAHVTVASTGSKALEMLRNEDFDALLSDYQMPGLNGEELCRSVRTCGRNEQIPIVMISAKGYEIDKPRLQFSARQMVDVVEEALASART
jgi:CheY-like chemotaxis protein